ncbi:MAG TPA: glycosyltransferase [Terracidiphilus sp.]|nr:glycosyltransferase [Terracidiphilus sp.]
MDALRVLLITYSFPPIGGTGVMRAASLARYLSSEGIRLDVLTARNASAVGSDPALLKEIPSEVTVHRTITLDVPFKIKKSMKRLIMGKKPAPGASGNESRKSRPGLLKRVAERILQPDPQVTWLPVLIRAARRIIRKRSIDLVVITVPPFSSLLVVEKLRKAFPGLAIVVDFRDEWLSTTYENVSFLFSGGERSRKLASATEAKAIKNATAVVAVTEAARREIRARYPEELDGKFHLIPNGFDATRLQRLSSHPQPRADGKIIITHVGTIYASTEPSKLIDALRSLPREVKDRFLIRFIGHIEEPRFREALIELGEMVELRGFLPQREALAVMSETDYVLLINHDPLNVGGKFYDYIGGGKPILGAAHPEGETRRLLEELRAGWWAANDDKDGIRRLFMDAAGRSQSLDREFRPDVERIAQYERKPLARRYAALLHAIAGRGLEDSVPTPPHRVSSGETSS